MKDAGNLMKIGDDSLEDCSHAEKLQYLFPYFKENMTNIIPVRRV